MEKEYLLQLGVGEEVAEAIRKAHGEEVEQLRQALLQSRIDSAVTQAGGRNLKAIRALLELEGEGDEDILKAVQNAKKECPYLFLQPPRFAPGTGDSPQIQPPQTLAAALREKLSGH